MRQTSAVSHCFIPYNGSKQNLIWSNDTSGLYIKQEEAFYFVERLLETKQLLHHNNNYNIDRENGLDKGWYNEACTRC